MKKNISLYEALTGVFFTVDHLDGAKIQIATKQGEVISPGTKKQITKKGMPYYKDAMSYGHLYIEFTVDFPKKGEMSNLEQLAKVNYY